MEKLKILLLMLVFALSVNLQAQKPTETGRGNYTANGIEWRFVAYSNGEASIIGTTASSTTLSGGLTIPASIIHNGVTYTVTSISQKSFFYYKKITSVVFPNTLKIIGSQAFGGCTGLTGVLIIPSSVKTIESQAFGGCIGLTGLVLQEGIEKIEDQAFGGCTGMRGDLTLPSTLRSVTNAFWNCQFDGTLTMLAQQQYITDSQGRVQVLPVFGYYSSFDVNDFSKITHFVFGGPEPSAFFRDTYPYLGVYFDIDASHVTSITFLPGVKKIPPLCFKNMKLSGLTSLVFPPNIEEIGDYAFQGATIPSHITIPATVKKMGRGCFLHVFSLEEMTVEGTPTEIPNLFCGACVNLSKVTLPNTVKRIGYSAFNGACFSDFTWPSALEEIGPEAFRQCLELTHVTPFPASLKRIENDAFQECTKLQGDANSFIPPSLKYIGAGAFSDNKGITGEAVLPSTLEPLREGEATGNPFARTGVYGIRMGTWPSYFAPSRLFNHRDDWRDDKGLLYIDARNCSLMLTNVKGDSNVAYKFTRTGWEENEYANFANTSINTLIYLPSEIQFQNPVLPVATFDQRFEAGFNPSAFGGSDGENFIMDGKCKYFYVADGLPYRVPIAFTALEAQYDREFNVTSGKAVSTLYLPYPTDLPAGMCAYTLVKKGLDAHGDKAFIFREVPQGTRLSANKPYLVRITDGQPHKLPVMHNVEVPVSPSVESAGQIGIETGDWKFYGTTEKIDNAAAYAKKAYYLNGNKWWAVQNGVENDYIAPFRCFVSSPTGAAASRSFVMVLDGDDDSNVTGINQLESDTEKDMHSGKYPFYSIDGKLMGKDYNKLERGQIYIVNGKKFYKF